MKDYLLKLIPFRNPEKEIKLIFWILLPIVIMGLLTIPNLGNRSMWIDESFCVVMGERTNTYGYPRAWDGTNFATVLNGADFIGDFHHILLNPFPYYVVSFGLLFSNTRFVILGLLSALFLYLLTIEFTNNHKVSYIALWLYCLSVPILIYIKTAQYYAPSLFFITISCYYYIKYMKKRKKSHMVCYIVFMILLLYSNYLFFGILFFSMILSCLLYTNDIIKNIKAYIKPFAIIILLSCPYILAKVYYLNYFGSTYPMQNWTGFITQFPGYFWQIQTYFFPFLTFAVIFILKFIFKLFRNPIVYNDNILNEIKTRKLKSDNIIYFLSISVILLNLIIISALTWDYATRYLIISIPFCYILSAIFLNKLLGNDRIAMIVVIAFFVFTNVIHEFPYFSLKTLNLEYSESMLIKPPVLYYDLEFLDAKNIDEYLIELDLKSTFHTYLSTYLKDYDNADEAVELFTQKYIKRDETMLNLSTSTFNIMYQNQCKIINYIENPDSIIMNSTYIQSQRPVSWGQNLHYLSLSYLPIEYVDWVVVNTEDIAADSEYLPEYIKLIILDGSKFERYDIEKYPFMPFVADIWTYNFETNYSYSGVTFFRNKLTTDAIEIATPII